MKINVSRLAFVAAACLLVPMSAFAGPLVTGYTGGSMYASYYGSAAGDVVGYRFTADSALNVTKLGIILDPSDGVLDYSHQVGLWRDSDQALLGSVVVNPATAQLIDGFLYQDLAASIDLSAGSTYTLGALYVGGADDWYVSYPSTLATDGISSTMGAYPADVELGFVYPGLTDSGNLGRLGPNAYASTCAVPVPGSILLLGLGTGLVARLRRRIA